MPTAYTPAFFDEELERIKKQKDKTRSYKASDYRQFVPQELDTSYIKPESFYQQQQDAILATSRAATALAMQKAQNLAAYRAMLAARRRQRNAAAVANYGSSGQSYGSTYGLGKGWKDNTPLSGVGVGANLTTVNWRGHSLTLNKSAVNNFVGFLNALWKTGYRPSVIGSYANRNIAGTDRKSLHAYGLAIDIDPSKNPVTWNGVPVTALPPGVGALAARYGLKWGGAWSGSKRDTMHFSIPWGGTM